MLNEYVFIILGQETETWLKYEDNYVSMNS